MVPQIVVRRLNEAPSRAGCPVLITLIAENESEESGQVEQLGNYDPVVHTDSYIAVLSSRCPHELIMYLALAAFKVVIVVGSCSWWCSGSTSCQ